MTHRYWFRHLFTAAELCALVGCGGGGDPQLCKEGWVSISRFLWLVIAAAALSVPGVASSQESPRAIADALARRFPEHVRKYDASGLPSQYITRYMSLKDDSSYEQISIFSVVDRGDYLETRVSRASLFLMDGDASIEPFGASDLCVSLGPWPNPIGSCSVKGQRDLSSPAEVASGGGELGSPGSWIRHTLVIQGGRYVTVDRVVGVRQTVSGLDWVPGPLVEVSHESTGNPRFSTFVSKILGIDVGNPNGSDRNEVVGLTVGGQSYGQTEAQVRQYFDARAREFQALARERNAQRRASNTQTLQMMSQALQGLRGLAARPGPTGPVGPAPAVGLPALTGIPAPSSAQPRCLPVDVVCQSGDASCQALPRCKH